MVASLRHESFYVEGTWFDESLGVYIGWVERHAQPMPLHSDSDDKVLVFSGEEFPEPGTALALKHRGTLSTLMGPSISSTSPNKIRISLQTSTDNSTAC